MKVSHEHPPPPQSNTSDDMGHVCYSQVCVPPWTGLHPCDLEDKGAASGSDFFTLHFHLIIFHVMQTISWLPLLSLCRRNAMPPKRHGKKRWTRTQPVACLNARKLRKCPNRRERGHLVTHWKLHLYSYFKHIIDVIKRHIQTALGNFKIWTGPRWSSATCSLGYWQGTKWFIKRTAWNKYSVIMYWAKTLGKKLRLCWAVALRLNQNKPVQEKGSDLKDTRETKWRLFADLSLIYSNRRQIQNVIHILRRQSAPLRRKRRYVSFAPQYSSLFG